MKRLYLHGWISKDHNGIITLKKINPKESKIGKRESEMTLIERIENFANKYGMTCDHEDDLGGRISFIPNCNLKIYFADKKCSLKKVMADFDASLYGGALETRVDWAGYSEYTILGMELNSFTIGGHDLNQELSSHYGEYSHIIIESRG